MQVHNVQQGSEAWNALRSGFDTASEAPIAAGKSKYTARTVLLHQKATGVTEEIDSYKQALFDKGHAAEEAARPIAEKFLDADLYPITVTAQIDGLNLLASLDGATLEQDEIFEHKLWSETLASDIKAGTLDPHYTIQMDQQLLVAGAKRCLFMTSDGTEEKMAWCWYESSPEKAAALIAAWKQFHADLEAYQPVQHAEKPAAAPIMQLPALAVQIRGEVVTSNLPAFRLAAEQFIANIKTELATDEDFAQAEANVKFCGEAEKNLELAKGAAIAQTASIDELMRTIDHIREQLRTKRLSLEKLVMAKKDSIKAEILATARLMFTDHVRALEAELVPILMAIPMPDFAGAAKNKRTLASLHDSVDTAMAHAKIAADATAKALREKLAWYNGTAAGFEFLFADLQPLVQKPADDFQLAVKSRIQKHKQDEIDRMEAERTRIAEEERIKAEKAAFEKVNAEAAARKAEEDRAAAAERNRQIQDSMLQRAQEKPSITVQVAPIDTGARIKLGEINSRLGFVVTADFLAARGFPQIGREGNAKLYWEHSFPAICQSIIQHIQAVASEVTQAA